MISDAEIDLTEHRDFGMNIGSRTTFINNNGVIQSNIGDIINKAYKKSVYGDKPWNVTPLYADKQPLKYDGILALGNKYQRKEAKYLGHWGTKDNLICDCCGKEYIKIPWKKDWGLCNECDKANKPPIVFPWENNR